MNKYELPYVEPDRLQRAAFEIKHGLSGEWERLGPSGQVHSVYRVGDVVVRIPRAHPEWIADTLTEAVALPAVVAAGVPTPRLIAFDNDQDVFDVPVVIAEYFGGKPVSPVTDSELFASWLGEALAKMHEDVREVPDPNGWLDSIETEDCRAEFEAATQMGVLSQKETQAVEDIIHRAEWRLDSAIEQVFLHNDVHVNNVLESDDGFALIDWGDAGWGDPSFDFMTLPPDWVFPVWKAYEKHRSLSPAFGPHVVWNQLGQALRRITGDPSRSHLGHLRLRQVAEWLAPNVLR